MFATMVSKGRNSSSMDTKKLWDKKMGKETIPSTPTETLMYHPQQTQYGTINGDIMGDICPTCHGIGRIPRGHEGQLVAVIPCSDQRLKPRRTKLSVCVSVVVCLLICSLVLFFLFPRTITVIPVSVQSVMVYFTPVTVDMQVTNLLNISNENFLEVKILDFSVQVLINQMIMGKIKILNMTSLKPRSQKSYTITIPVVVDDVGMNTYCKSTSFKIHTLFLHLQMTMNVSYLAHTEQLSKDTFEYIDCGVNTTNPHPIMT